MAKGLHLRLNENEMTYSLFDGEKRIGVIFEHEICFDNDFCHMQDIAYLVKVVKLLKQAEKKTELIMKKLFSN